LFDGISYHYDWWQISPIPSRGYAASAVLGSLGTEIVDRWKGSSGAEGEVSGEHVRKAVRRTKRRADLPARRFRELVADGRIRIATQGMLVGQRNGLAVIRPSR
jgi:hypothetical protein